MSKSSRSPKNPLPPVQVNKESLEKTYTFKSLSDACDDPLNKATKLDELNADEFVPQSFVSSRKAVAPGPAASSIVINLEEQTIKVPTNESTVPAEDPLFHSTVGKMFH